MSSDFIIRSVVRICFQSVSEYPTEARKEQSLPRPFINIDDGPSLIVGALLRMRLNTRAVVYMYSRLTVSCEIDKIIEPRVFM